MRWAAIAVAACLAGPCWAQDAEEARALLRRVRLDPEIELADSLQAFDEAGIAHLAGQVMTLALPRSVAGYEFLATGLLERLANDRYDKALHEYRTLLQEDDARLALRPLSEIRGTDTLTSRDSHALVQDWLVRLPPSILQRYRQRIDAEAARLLKEGTANRDAGPLRRLVRDYRASAQADAALALLGDLAFERGDFEQALDGWRRIALLPSQQAANRRGLPAVEIRDGVDIPRIHAKQTLALIFAARPEAVRELEAFRALYPSQRGAFAGRNALYHEILAHWLHEIQAQPPRDGDDPWPTLAGGPSRNRVLRGALNPRLWLDGAAWRMPLPTFERDEAPPVWLSSLRSLTIAPTPFHPVIAEGQILLNDGQIVRSLDLLTGQLRFRASSAAPFLRREEFKTPAELAFGLSTSPGRAFARIGTRPGDPEPRRLIAIDIQPETEAIDRVVWSADANGDDNEAFFETDPLVVGDRVYIGTLHKGEPHTPRYLSCFDLAGALLWQTKIANFGDATQRRPHRQALLVGAGSTVVYATHAGTAVAVDAWTGRRMWAFRYPSVDRGMSPRGASSCLAADGRIYLAPVDAAGLYCLEGETGRLVWERPWVKAPSDIIVGPATVSEVVDLLGVVSDRLIFTDRSRIQALDARTGGALEWQQPGTGTLPGQGRGLLAGSWLFWPTADPDVSWRALTQTDGALHDSSATPQYYDPTSLRTLPAGNIIFGQGCLAIAGTKELIVFAPPARRLPQLEREPQARKDPARLFRIAMAQLDAGRPVDAAASLAALKAQAPRGEWSDWQNLIRQRTTPQPPPAKIASLRPVQVLPSTTQPAAAVALSPKIGRFAPAWGPTRGVAPPIELDDETRSNDITVLLDGSDIAFLNVRTGVELFRRPRRITTVDWLGRRGAHLLVAGPDGVEAFDLDARRPTWHVRAPALAAGTWQLVGDRPQFLAEPERLSEFQFYGNMLVCFSGRARLLAIEPETGWLALDQTIDPVRALDGGPRYPLTTPWPSKHGHPFPIALDFERYAKTAAPMADDRAEERRRVMSLEGVRSVIGKADGQVLLRREAEPDHAADAFRPPWPTSLTGAAAHVFGGPRVCLALIPRNQGFELVRFKDHPFEPLWTVPALELRDGFDVHNATCDERAVYFVHAGSLEARALDTGKTLWRLKLPAASGAWKAEQAGGGLLVWAQSTAGLPALAGPVHPLAATLTVAAGRRGIGAVPILFVDPSDGSTKQRLDVPHDGGPAFVNRQGTTFVVTAGGLVRAWQGAP